VMRSQQMALLISTLMVTASIGSIVARPDIGAASPEPALSLEAMIPKRFGDWREKHFEHVVNPQERELLDKLYSDTLSRTYVNSSGYMIMLSLAHGRDQRGDLEAHMPEKCYPANGFTLHRTESGQLPTPFGEISVRRLFTSRGAREEPVTYWFTFGGERISLDQAERRLRRRLVELRYAFTGRIPDGLLFRVSSIDRDQARANQLQHQFVNDLLRALSPPERKRLSGLGDS
jgi:EpsI family protein